MKLQALIELYQASSDFKDLAPNSQSLYQQMIDAMYAKGIKSLNVDTISPTYADTWFRAWSTEYGVSKAQMMCKVMRKIWNWGYRAELIVRNPWSQMQLKSLPARQVLWTKEDFEVAFKICREEHYPVMSRLLQLLRETAQRPSDILNLTATNFPYKYQVVVRQSKTGKSLMLTLSEKLWSHCKYELVNVDPSLFSANFIRNYHNIFAGMKSRGLNANLQLRDIRRTVATEMAEGGATDEQIRALLGHSGHSKMPETVYVVRNAKMAGDGLAMRAKHLASYLPGYHF